MISSLVSLLGFFIMILIVLFLENVCHLNIMDIRLREKDKEKLTSLNREH